MLTLSRPPHATGPVLLDQLSSEGPRVVTAKHRALPVVDSLRVQLHQRRQQLAQRGAAVGLVARHRIGTQIQVSQRRDLAAQAVHLLQPADLGRMGSKFVWDSDAAFSVLVSCCTS